MTWPPSGTADYLGNIVSPAAWEQALCCRSRTARLAPDRKFDVLQKLRAVRDCRVIEIGTGGSEHDFPREPFADLLRQAREWGFRTIALAGEAACRRDN